MGFYDTRVEIADAALVRDNLIVRRNHNSEILRKFLTASKDFHKRLKTKSLNCQTTCWQNFEKTQNFSKNWDGFCLFVALIFEGKNKTSTEAYTPALS